MSGIKEDTKLKQPEILEEERIYHTPIGTHGRTDIFMYKVKYDNGTAEYWEVPVSKDVVATVAVDNDEQVLFVEQYRPAWKRRVLVIPGGGIEKENPNEDYSEDARKELKQEVGYDFAKENLEKLGVVLCSGRIRSKHHIYLATEIFPSSGESEDYEKRAGIAFCRLTLDEAIKRFVEEKEETTSYTLLGLLLAKRKLKEKGILE